MCYKGHLFPVWCVRFSPHGYYFATSSHDKTARLWATDSHQPLRIFAGHYSDVDVSSLESPIYRDLSRDYDLVAGSTVSSEFQLRGDWLQRHDRETVGLRVRQPSQIDDRSQSADLLSRIFRGRSFPGVSWGGSSCPGVGSSPRPSCRRPN